VSKRNIRRIALVAGAALALGSMAPAMAARIDVDGDASADVTLPELGDLGLPLGDLTGLVNVGNISALNNLAIGDVSAIVNVLGLNVSDITANVLDSVNVGDITANVLDAGTVNVANVLASVGDVTATVGDVTATVGDVTAQVANVAAIANVGDITANVGDVLSNNDVLGGGLLGDGLLGLPLGSILDASLTGNISLLANVMGAL
jgi:hypothetical protein